EARIFEYVLNENKLIAKETFFVDDNIDNIKAGKNIGILTAIVDNDIEIIIEKLKNKKSE
ncbi:MAG: hypothetical protein U9O87_03730, partial [Verrucomicrobiota bacterium]|nr:hypothetical protein [Verrucomicrobiota bacterium]